MTKPLPDSPVPFGYKTCWLAVKSEDSLAIASALGVTDPEPSAWEQGIEAAYEGSVFITPPIHGWTLVVGDAVAPGVEQPQGGWLAKILRLSKRFGEVQMFATHRVVELHAWARARAGVLERAYCYIGESDEITYDEGEPSAVEREFGLKSADSGRADAEDAEDSEREGLVPDEEFVMAVAGQWSVAPTELSESSAPPGLGLVLARSRKPWWRFW